MLDGGWEQLANAYADVLSIEGAGRADAGRHRQAPGARVRGGARRRREGRGDVPLRADGRAARSATRSPTSIASTARSSSGPSWPACSSSAPSRPTTRTTRSSSTRGSVRSTRSGSARSQDAIRAYRVIFDELAPTNEDAIAALGRIYEQTENWTRARQGLPARARQRRRRRPGGRDPREDRAPRRRPARQRGRRDRGLEARARSARRGSGGAAALWRGSTSSRASGPSSPTCSSGTSTSPTATRTAWLVLDPPRAPVRRAAQPRRRGARDLAARARHRLLERRGAARHRARLAHAPGSERARAALCTPRSIARRRCSSRGARRRSIASSARPTAACSSSRTRRPTPGASCSRSTRPTSRRWPSSRRSTAPRSAGPTWSTSRCSAPTRSQEPAEKIRELLEVTEIWKNEVHDYDQATPAFEKILGIDPTHNEAFEALERLHTRGRALGAADRALPDSPRDPRDRRGQERPLAPHRARVRGAARRQEPGVRRAGQRLQRGLRRRRDGALPRAHGAGHRALGRADQHRQRLAAASRPTPKQKIQLCLRLGKWYGEDLGHPEYAQPYYAQIMAARPEQRAGPAPDGGHLPHGRAVAEGGRDADARARRRGRQRGSQGDPGRPRRAARTSNMGQLDQGIALLQARARGRSAVPAGARARSSASTRSEATTTSSSTS